VSLALIVFLLGQRARDLTALRWGLIAFLTGETFCAINFWIFRHDSLLSEYLHSYGMALAFGLIAFALLDGLDARLLRIDTPDASCLLAGRLCETRQRHSPGGCAARRSAQLALVLAAVLAFLPLMAGLAPHAYLTRIFGFPYSYTRFELYEWYERRALPLIALVCFGLAWLPFLRRAAAPIPFASKALFCAGIGALGFSLFRLALASIFSQNLVWFEFWEETSELMFVLGCAFFVWQFRHVLARTGIAGWIAGG
jgi:hypothetical protein